MRATILALSLLSTAALARSEARNVPEFDAVHVSAGIHLTVDIGPQRPVHIETDDETLQLVETVVEDGALQIRFKPHHWRHGDHEVRVNVQTPQLHGIGASGG